MQPLGWLALCATLADANVLITWRMGKHGDSCTQTCAAAGTMRCTQDFTSSPVWPTTSQAVVDIAADMAFTCSGMTATTHTMGPAVHDYGTCMYAHAAHHVQCSATPDVGYRRLCPCTSSDLRFVMGHPGSSCQETCLRRGGQCHDNHRDWPVNRADMEHAVKQTGHVCGSTGSSGVHFAPYVRGGACFFAARSGLAQCSAFDPQSWRLCPCVGASEHDPSGAPHQPPPPHQSTQPPQVGRGSSGHDSNSRWCHFKDGNRHGGTQHKLQATFNHQAACKAAVAIHCPAANGVTFSESLGECWCNTEMTGIVPSPTMRTCWYEGAGMGSHHPHAGSGTSRGHTGQGHTGHMAVHCSDGNFHSSAGHGGTQHKLQATYSSAEACRNAVATHCPSANGATFSPSLGECWCNTGMTGCYADPVLLTTMFVHSGGSGNTGNSGTSNGGAIWGSPGNNVGNNGNSGSSNGRATTIRSCRGGGYTAGKSHGGSSQKLAATFYHEASCTDAVQRHCVDSNGATYSPALGECWCNTGMLGITEAPNMRTCQFETQSVLWSLGSFAGLPSSSSSTSWLAAPSLAAFVGAALVGAAAGLASLRRRGASQQQQPHLLAQEGDEAMQRVLAGVELASE